MKLSMIIIGLMVLSLPFVSAINLTDLVKNSGRVNLNRNQIAKLETKLGLDFSQFTGYTGTLHVTINNYLVVGDIVLIYANINGYDYTVIMSMRKIQEAFA